MSEQVPSIGRIVHYRLNAHDAGAINRRRDDAFQHRDTRTADGSQIHTGNGAHPGDAYPLIITRVWGTDPGCAVNGQVLLDGNDTLWVTSRCGGEGEGQYSWPVRA